METELEERERTGVGTLGSMLLKIDPFVPRADHHNPRELRSWAKRTGFVSNFSTETASGERNDSSTSGLDLDLEKGFRGHRAGGSGSSPKIEIDPLLGRTRPNGGAEIETVSVNGNGESQRRVRDENGGGDRDDGFGRGVGINGNGKGNKGVDERVSRVGNGNGNGNGVGVALVNKEVEAKKEDGKAEVDVEVNGNVNPEGDDQEPVQGGGDWRGPFGIKCGLRDNRGFVPLMCYGL